MLSNSDPGEKEHRKKAPTTAAQYNWYIYFRWISFPFLFSIMCRRVIGNASIQLTVKTKRIEIAIFWAAHTQSKKKRFNGENVAASRNRIKSLYK